MFKDYKEIFKNLRDVQDQLWKDSMAAFPVTTFQNNMSELQKQTFDSVNNMVGQAIGQSLELQQQWLEQWSERAGGKKLKPKLFAELSAEARDSTQKWLDNQNQLLEQWLEVVNGTTSATRPDFAEWEKTVQESIQRQKTLLNDWLEMADFKKLSVKEITNLSNQITKSMQKSIETQQQVWSHWFNDLGATAAAVGKMQKEAAPAADKPKKKSAAKSKAAAADSDQSGDDLKQISGIGPGLEKKLKAGGITTLKQIAALSDADIADLEERIIRFSGRIKREQWVEQARKLVS
jgi:predicted flap endonuclease-1-like 5' DNA nuclease